MHNYETMLVIILGNLNIYVAKLKTYENNSRRIGFKPSTRSLQFLQTEKLLATDLAGTSVLSQEWLHTWKQTSHDVLDSVGITRPAVFLLVINLLVTILEVKPHGSFSTSLIKYFQHRSWLFFMPCLRDDFAIFNASRSRESPFERVNLRRAVRHSWSRTDNWSFLATISPTRIPLLLKLQKITDARTGATNKDPSPPWCILIPSRVFGPFVLLTNEQHN